MEQQITYPQLPNSSRWLLPSALDLAGKNVVLSQPFPVFSERPLINTDSSSILTRWIPDFSLADPLKSEFLTKHPLLSQIVTQPSFHERLKQPDEQRTIKRQLFWDIAEVLTESDWGKINDLLKPFSSLDLFIKFCSATFKKNKFYTQWPQRLSEKINEIDYEYKDYLGFRLAYYTLVVQLRGSEDTSWNPPSKTHEMGFDSYIQNFYKPNIDLSQTFKLLGHNVKNY